VRLARRCTEYGASWWYSDERGFDELDFVECLACGATTHDIRSAGKTTLRAVNVSEGVA
jgi:hypothetical protein